MNKRLFCFPYSGASATYFHKWKRLLNNSIELVPVDYAGRGSRYNEPLITDMQNMAEDLFLLLIEQLNEGPYILFGHSVGALIIYELYKKILDKALVLPDHVYLSATAPPHVRTGNQLLECRNDDELIQALIRLGGGSEIYDNPQLCSFFLPIIKADLKVYASQRDKAIQKVFRCPVTVLYGEEDISCESMQQWEYYSEGGVKTIGFPGGHFFIHDEYEQIIYLIKNDI